MAGPTQGTLNPFGLTDTAGSVPSGVTGLASDPGAAKAGRIIRTHKILLKDLVVAITDTGGASGAYGSQKIFDFPEGNILILGAQARLTDVDAGAGGITDTATVKFSIGSAAETTNDTLDSTQANLIASTNVALTGGTSTATVGAVNTGVLFLDGTTTPADLYLNLGIADAGITANDDVTIDGEIEITYIVLGDK